MACTHSEVLPNGSSGVAAAAPCLDTAGALNSELARSIGASTFSYPRIHEMSLVQLPPSMLNRSSSAVSSAMTAASRCGPSPGSKRSHPMLEQWLQRWQLLAADPQPSQGFEVFGDVHGGGGGPRATPDDNEGSGRGIVHHAAAVLAVGDLGDQRRNPSAGQFNGPEALGLVVGLHLAHELGVAALGLDDRDDARRVAEGVCADEPVRQMRALNAPAAGLLHGMFLDQHPLVAAVKQRADELVSHIGLVDR